MSASDDADKADKARARRALVTLARDAFYAQRRAHRDHDASMTCKACDDAREAYLLARELPTTTTNGDGR